MLPIHRSTTAFIARMTWQPVRQTKGQPHTSEIFVPATPTPNTLGTGAQQSAPATYREKQNTMPRRPMNATLPSLKSLAHQVSLKSFSSSQVARRQASSFRLESSAIRPIPAPCVGRLFGADLAGTGLVRLLTALYFGVQAFHTRAALHLFVAEQHCRHHNGAVHLDWNTSVRWRC